MNTTIKFTLITILGCLLAPSISFSQSVDTIQINGENYFVYPFNIVVEEHAEYIALINHKKYDVGKINAPYFVPYDSYEYYEVSGKRKRKFIKAARQNPYPLLQQQYEINYDIIPALDSIPDGKYIQFFENFCLVDSKGYCQEQTNRIAGYFTIKNNTLDGEACWIDLKGDTLKNGNFSAGLKEGVWRLENRELGYDMGEKSYESYVDFGYPIIDTTIEFWEFKNGLISGIYRKFKVPNFASIQGNYLNNAMIGEWIYRDFLQGDDEYDVDWKQDRTKSIVTRRFSFANVEDSIVVKQPWIRNGLINCNSADPLAFRFYSGYRFARMNENLFVFPFHIEENLEYEEEKFGSYQLEIGEMERMRYNEFNFEGSSYQPTVFYEGNYLNRGHLIDSIGLISKYDGVMERFYPNGQLQYRYVFENGKLLKEDTIFWDNGQAHDVINFVADSNHYVRSIYDAEGKLFKELVYDSLGDYSRIQYIYDSREYAYIESYKMLNYKSNNFFVYNNLDTLNYQLESQQDLFLSWYKADTSLVIRRTYNPITRTLIDEEYNVIGNPKERSVKSFSPEFESWTGNTSIKYGDLELVSTESGTFSDFYKKDSIPQTHVLAPNKKFNIAKEYVLFKAGHEYTGEVELNFEKHKFKNNKDQLRINFTSYNVKNKKKNKMSEQVKARIVKYHKTGKGKEDDLLNYIDASEHKVDYSQMIFNDIFYTLLNYKFVYPRSNKYGSYNGIDISRRDLRESTKIVGFMQNGKPHGIWKAYDENNKVYLEVPFYEGEVDGKFKLYQYEYPSKLSGNPSWDLSPIMDTFPQNKMLYNSVIGDFKNGKLDGNATYYDWIGGITRQEEFKEGDLDGLSINRNQLAYSKSNYKNGYLDGYVQTYLLLPHRDSILLYDLNFQNGSLQGESKSYHINGNLSKRGFFLDGLPIEDYEAFDSLGFKFHYVKFQYSFPVEEKIWEENQLSVRYQFKWEDSIHFEPKDITSSQSLDRMLIDLGIINPSYYRPYYGRPSLVEKEYIKYHMTKYYPNDTVARDGALDGSKKYGPWKFYNYEGDLLYTVEYHDSIIQLNDSIRFKSKGVYVKVDEVGDTLYTAHIIEKFEKYDCSHTDHYEIRQLYTIRECDESQGRMNGYVHNFYDNGVLQNEGLMKDGYPTGIWKFYDPYGKLNQYGNYVLGKRNGRWLSGDLSKTKYLGDICLNPNLPDLEDEIKYRENLLDITITNYKLGTSLNKQYYDVNMNRFVEDEVHEDIRSDIELR